MVVIIVMVFIIMDIDNLDMVTIILVGIGTIMVDAIEHVMDTMGTTQVEDTTSVQTIIIIHIEQSAEVKIEVEHIMVQKDVVI